MATSGFLHTPLTTSLRIRLRSSAVATLRLRLLPSYLCLTVLSRLHGIELTSIIEFRLAKRNARLVALVLHVVLILDLVVIRGPAQIIIFF